MMFESRRRARAIITSAREGPLGALAFLVPLLFMLVFQTVFFPAPSYMVINGVILGGLSSLLAIGIALVFRANRIVNFAQGDLGMLPATLAVLLIGIPDGHDGVPDFVTGLGYVPGFVIGLAAALLLGALVEWLFVRRFFRAPRLVLTVATIGIAQILAGLALLLPRAFDTTVLRIDRLDPPFEMEFTLGARNFNTNEALALIAVPVVLGALAAFFRFSHVGIAVRGSAERADRASMLGIPVKRLHTIVWILAAVLAYITVFLRAGIVSLPIGAVLGPAVLLPALAAAVIGRMDNLPSIAAAAVGLGIVEQGVLWNYERDIYVAPVLFVIVFVALLLQGRMRSSRVVDQAVSTWQAAREVRPVPRELARLPEVRVGRVAATLALFAAVATLPLWLSPSRISLAGAIMVYGIIGISLVALTGWAGQVSLGQMAFVGFGAAAGGYFAESQGWDLVPVLLAGGLAGAALMVVIGVPALRAGGLAFAVVSLALALAVRTWFLDVTVFPWIPSSSFERPQLGGGLALRGRGLETGGVSLESETTTFFVCLAVLVLVIVAAHLVRRSRLGRELVALRENERAAQAYGIRSWAVHLGGFAFAGFVAGLAGALFAVHQEGLLPDQYWAGGSLQVFAMVVIGGLGSIPGALIGAAYVYGVQWFLPTQWEFLASGIGLLFVLMVMPGGIGAALADTRDALLRRIAKRRGILVPSLVADRRVEPELAPAAAAAAAAGIQEAADQLVEEAAP